MLSVEIIASGSELTSGDRLNTNAQWLSLQLADLGFQPRWHTTVGDLYQDNVDAVKIALSRADFVVMTGGLGPTQDDLTRDVLVEVGHAPLEFRSELMEHIAKVFAIRGIEMPERNRVQAFMPRGSTALTNPLGTAPGIWMISGGKPIVALPGVPREMFRMWTDHVIKRLIENFGPQGKVLKRKINLFGLGESAVEAKILDLTDRHHIPEVGITASEGMISLRIAARCKDEKESQAQLAKVAEVIYQRLGEYVFSEGEVGLADALLARCRELTLSVAVVEIDTGGILAQRLLTRPCAETGVKVVSSTFASPNDFISAQKLASSDRNSVEILADRVREMNGCSLGIYLQLNPPLNQALDSKPLPPTGEVFETVVGLSFPDTRILGGYRAVGSRAEILSRSVNYALALALKSLKTAPL